MSDADCNWARRQLTFVVAAAKDIDVGEPLLANMRPGDEWNQVLRLRRARRRRRVIPTLRTSEIKAFHDRLRRVLNEVVPLKRINTIACTTLIPARIELVIDEWSDNANVRLDRDESIVVGRSIVA